MRIPPRLLFTVLLPLCFAPYLKAQEATRAHKDSLEAIVNQYYELNVKIFQEGSTVEDIDRFFAIFTDDFTYVHPKYGGTYSRQDLYDGYVRNQKNGGYNGRVSDILIKNKITGLNAMTVQKAFLLKEGDSTTEGEAQMTLFEFSGGKISRIFEYW